MTAQAKKRVIKRRIVAYTGPSNANNAIANLECGHSEAISYGLTKLVPLGTDMNCWRCTNSFAAKIGLPFGVQRIFLIPSRLRSKVAAPKADPHKSTDRHITALAWVVAGLIVALVIEVLILLVS